MQWMRLQSGATLLAIIMVPIGIASLWVSEGPARVAESTPWLFAGWTCLVCGLVARRIAAWSFMGTLLLAVGVTWLLPDVSSCLNLEPISHRCFSFNAGAWVAAVSWLWLGLAGHAVITFPDGRVTRGPLLGAVFSLYVLTLGIGLGADPARPLLAALLIAAPLAAFVLRTDGYVTAWAASTVAGVALAVAILLDPGTANALAAGVVGASLLLLVGLAFIARVRASLTADRAVQLGPALADVLGDATFRIAVRSPNDDGWLSTSGRSVPGPVGGGAAFTSIVRDNVEIARMTHDRATLADPDIRAAVVTAVELEAHNTRLGADLRAQADALASSRRRLLDAALRERESLGRQVEVDVMLRLDLLARDVQAVPPGGLTTEIAERLRRVSEAIDVARAEVAELALGLYPSALIHHGLVGALRELAAMSPIEVRIEAPDGATGGPDADATLYFLCAEGLANAARHARASSVQIEIEQGNAELTVSIEDDGVGGADFDKGTGLRGLRDRVEALGGTLGIESTAEKGTRLMATIPVGHEAH